MNKRKNYKIIFCFSIMIIVSGIQGDEWFFDSKTNDLAFGKTKIVQQIDASKSRTWPVFTLCIYYKDQLMAKYKNIYCEEIFSSPDRRYFLGVSNCGVPGTAFVIFDYQGNLIREEKHDFFNLPYYCSESVIISRVWYNAKNPNTEFVYKNGRLEKILVNSCKTERYNLLDRIVVHRGKTTKKPIKENT